MGIAGLISIVRTMADRNDVRQVVLLYGNCDWDAPLAPGGCSDSGQTGRVTDFAEAPA